ncbi:carbohydrate ABC transporter permease [Arachnia propionica]|uniref:Sugar ABC transporter permease n=1 Tax=Arachnia propionica TaxID=1750 RepID=A0A3P1WRI3_9ACTN|nr:sugar ABC transporter permease [Arachnia propionica]RRD49232.1 sugar ABC transporter permease [Arachnia propionica]
MSTTVDRPRRRISRQARHQAISGWLFALPFVLLFCLVFIAPIVVSVIEGFHRNLPKGGGLFGGGELVRTFVGWQNFQEVAANPAFWAGVGRVMLFGAFQIPIMIGAALLLALLLDSYLVRRPGLWRLAYFLPFAVPGLVAAILWRFLYQPTLSPFAGALPFDLFGENIILASMANMTTWTYTGYNMLIFLAALQAIPGELYEAARIDGASGWRITTRIKIPLVRGAALLAVLLSIIGTIQLFNEPAVLQHVATWMPQDYTPMMMAYNTAYGALTPGGPGPASAVTILMALVAGVLAFVYAMIQRKVD